MGFSDIFYDAYCTYAPCASVALSDFTPASGLGDSCSSLAPTSSTWFGSGLFVLVVG